MQKTIYSFELLKRRGIMPLMRLQPIIVPGWKNSGPEHWQSRWQELLPHAQRVEQRDWENPRSADWISRLAAEVDEARSPVLLIAHSLGCVISAALPVPLRAKVAGALLVAPADVERTDAPECLRGFAPVSRQPLPFQSVVVASDNDPYCALERARAFAADWGSRVVVISGAGHINGDSGLGDWPQGLKLLGALRRRASWRVSPPPERISPIPIRPLSHQT
jgi:predicted alpha/beta hydrolase family esterase